MIDRELDMVSLRLLSRLADGGSIGAAARSLGMSQPAASMMLRQFESRWQITVAVRSPRGTTLTADGRAVTSWARAVLDEADTMLTALTALGERRRQGLAVAASLTIAELVMPRWLGELHSREPELQPSLRVVNSESVEALVRNGDVELGFIETALTPLGLQARVVGRDRLVIVVEPDHPWATRAAPVPLSDLRAAEFVLREPGSGTRSTFERALGSSPMTTLEASSTTALVGAAVAGVGPAVVSVRAAAQYVEAGRLVVVPTGLDLMRPLTAIWQRGRRLGRGAEQLLRVAAADDETQELHDGVGRRDHPIRPSAQGA